MHLRARSYKDKYGIINFKFRIAGSRQEKTIDYLGSYSKSKNLYITVPSRWSANKIIMLLSSYYLIDKKVYIL